jgi:alkylation response protein AidB-like acyl-CoA dehydrogenase
MQLLLTQEQEMLRDSVRDFLASEAPVSHLRELRDTNDAQGFSPALWRHFGELGFAGALLPESDGGSSLGHVEAAIVMEQLGAQLTPSPFWSTSVVGALALLHAGGAAGAHSDLLRSIAAGKTVIALALEEKGKHDPAGIAMQASRSGSGFTLTGSKCFVVNGHVAQHLLVAARTSGQPGDTQGITLFLLDRGTPGISVERTAMVDGHNAARVVFDAVQAADSTVLGQVGEGWQVLAPVLESARLCTASEQVGVAAAAFAKTLAYLKERSQFGKPIGSFQALQHRAARLYGNVELARAIVLKAAVALDAGSPQAPFLVAVAKAKAGTVCTQAVQEGVQMHGGMGMTDEMDVGLYMKRARVLQEVLGDHRFHAGRVAAMNGY